MIAVSSFKPLSKSDSIAYNQVVANHSWRTVFSDIVYFNDHEKYMDGRNVVFIPHEPFPKIKALAEFCAKQNDWCCIINADIVVEYKMCEVERQLKALYAKCATSRRYDFDIRQGIGPHCRVVDLGFDIFCAVPEMWQKMAEVVPDQFRIGHCFWDTWTLGFFNVESQGRWYDFTPSRCIFHPRHGERTPTFEINTQFSDKYTQSVSWPKRKIDVNGQRKALVVA